MLNQPTIDRLRELKLPGMAIALQRQLDQPDLHRLAFEERLALLIDAEVVHRDAERLKRLLRQAQFRQHAALENLDTPPPAASTVRSSQRSPPVTGFSRPRISSSPDRPAPAKAGLPRRSATPPADSASPSVMNGPDASSKSCASPAPTPV